MTAKGKTPAAMTPKELAAEIELRALKMRMEARALNPSGDAAASAAPSMDSPTEPEPAPTATIPVEVRRAFELLRLEPTRDTSAVKSAYREVMREHHPDVSKDLKSREIATAAGEALLTIEAWLSL